MNAEELQFGLNTVLSLIFGSGGALGVWFGLKNRLNLANAKIDELSEDNRNAHKRISNLKDSLDKHKEMTQEFRIEIKSMEIRLVEKITEAIKEVSREVNNGK